MILMIKTMYKRQVLIHFTSGSLVVVGCKLVQFVVYCVLFVMISTKIEKKFGCFSGGTCLDCLWFLSGRKPGQDADQELLKSLFQNKTPDLSLKYTLIQILDQQGQQ